MVDFLGVNGWMLEGCGREGNNLVWGAGLVAATATATAGRNSKNYHSYHYHYQSA